MVANKNGQARFARSNLLRISILTAILLLDLAILLGIILQHTPGTGFHASLRAVQVIVFLTAAGVGGWSAFAALRLRRAGQSEPEQGDGLRGLGQSIQWSLYLTVILLAATWALWNYRIDGVLTWPDTEDYAMIASQTWYSPTFWTGGNPPGLPLIFKVFGLNWDTFIGPEYEDIAPRITGFMAVLSFLSVSLMAYSLAAVIRQKWLQLLAVVVVFGLGLSIDVAQWNKMLLSESLSTSLFFGLIAGAILLSLWGDRTGKAQTFLVVMLTVALAAGVILYVFTRDVNSYFLFFLGVLSLPPVIVMVARRKRWWWAYTVIVGIMLLAAVGSALSRRARWSYPFNNLVFDRVLPDQTAVDFFVRHDFPIEVIESIQPQSRNDLQVAYKGEQGEPLRAWFENNARSVHVKFLLSRPVDTLMEPLADLPALLSPDVSWYRVRIHPEPTWIPIASAIFYPKSSLILGLWSVVVLGLTAALVRAGRGQTIWAIPLFLLATLYPLFLVIWHGDSAAMERHSYPVGLGLRLSLWVLTFFILDVLWTRRACRSSHVNIGDMPDLRHLSVSDAEEDVAT